MKYPIIMHVNYCEQGQTIEQICKVAAMNGYDGIEFRANKTAAFETLEAYLDEVKRCATLYGIRYTLFGGGINVMTQDKAVRDAEVERYNHFIDLAAERNLLSMNNFFTGALIDKNQPMNDVSYGLHGSFCAQDWHYEVAAEACQQVSDHAKQYDVRFAFETHMNYLHDIAESAKKLVDMIDRDNFGVNLDYGNSIFFLNRPILPLTSAIAHCGNKLFYTHMKNYQPIPRPQGPFLLATALGDGSINHRQYVKKLIEIGFTGFVGIEAPRSGDREWYAAQDVKYIKSVMADLM